MTQRSKTQIRNGTPSELQSNPPSKKTRFHHEFKVNLHEFFCCQFCLVRSSNPKSKKTFTQKVCWLFFLLESGQKPSQKPPLNPGGPSTTMCFMGTRRRVALEAKSFNSSPPWGFFGRATGHLGNIYAT